MGPFGAKWGLVGPVFGQMEAVWELLESGGCMRANGVCGGYWKPGKGYWAAKIGQVATVWGLVRAV